MKGSDSAGFTDTPANFKAFAHGMSQKQHCVLAYLLSATFKDCSVIIRGHEDNVKSATATIIDLDSMTVREVGEP